jgi:hypothetical protein
VSEKTSKQEGETYDTWADHFSTYKPQGLPDQQMSKAVEQASPLRGTDVTNMEASYGRVNSAPVVPPTEQPPQLAADDSR